MLVFPHQACDEISTKAGGDLKDRVGRRGKRIMGQRKSNILYFLPYGESTHTHTHTPPIHEYGKEVEEWLSGWRKRTCKRGKKGWGGQWGVDKSKE